MFEFLNPVWFAFSRSEAMNFSSSVRKLAVAGESGSRNNMTTPHKNVMIPNMMKSHKKSQVNDFHQRAHCWICLLLTCHALRRSSICRIPTAIKFPKISDKEFPQNQIPWRSGCSDVLYQSDVIRVKPGERLASVHPRKNRTTIKPAKFVVAAWHARTMDHKILKSGEQLQWLCRKWVGYWQDCGKIFSKWKFDHQQWCWVAWRSELQTTLDSGSGTHEKIK